MVNQIRWYTIKYKKLFRANVSAAVLHTILLVLIVYRYLEDKKLCKNEDDSDREVIVCKNKCADDKPNCRTTSGFFYFEGDKYACPKEDRVQFCPDGTPVLDATDCQGNKTMKVCTNGYLIDPEGPEKCQCLKNSKKVELLRDAYINDYRRDTCTDYDEKCEYWPYIGYKKAGANVNMYTLIVFFTVVTILAHVVYAVGGYTKLPKAYYNIKSSLSILKDEWKVASKNDRSELEENISKIKENMYKIMNTESEKHYYNKIISNGHNPLRWIEYSLSAPVMLIILALLCSVRNQNQLILLGVAAAVQIMQGWFIEDAIVQKKYTRAWVHFGIAVGLLVATWYGVLDSWYRGIQSSFQTYKDCSDSERGQKAIDKMAMPPQAIEHVIIIVLLLFAVFGFISFVHLFRASRGYEVNFKNYEFAYILMSFISKATLIMFCVFSIFEGELTWLQSYSTHEMKTRLRKILIDPYVADDNLSDKLIAVP
jgi:hypothetical protein